MAVHKKNQSSKGNLDDSGSINEDANSADRSNDQDDDLKEFIEALRHCGGKSGNLALRQKLGWNDTEKDRARYWETHGRALDKGLTYMGRGQGGSVYLNVETDAESNQNVAHSTRNTATVRETELYPGAHTVIERDWVKSARYDEYIVEQTAAKGRAQTGGKWSRPDISVLAIKSYQYLPNRQFDIVTFEIKPEGQTSVEGVFEALSHQQFATKSYVIFHMPRLDNTGQFVEEQSYGERIVETARKHGIGIIVATQIDDWESWDELVPAERHIPDAEQTNRFIATCFSDSTKEKIIKWQK